MKIIIFSESRADFGGLEPVGKEAKKRCHNACVYRNPPFLEYFKKVDWLIFLGDRVRVLWEILKVAENFPDIGLAHLSGGDRQEGRLIDEPVRHALSKFAHVHFPCTKQSADRLIRQGEDPRRIHCVGSTMVDALVDFKPVLNKKRYKKYDLIQMHPAPGWRENLKEITSWKFPQKIMSPNDDKGFGEKPKGIEYIDTLPREDFLQLLWNCRYFVGNSSAAYLEAQYLGVPCVQVGERNRGRKEAFPGEIVEINDGRFFEDNRTEVGLRENWKDGAHGDGMASGKILDVLEAIGKPDKEFLRKEWV